MSNKDSDGRTLASSAEPSETDIAKVLLKRIVVHPIDSWGTAFASLCQEAMRLCDGGEIAPEKAMAWGRILETVRDLLQADQYRLRSKGKLIPATDVSHLSEKTSMQWQAALRSSCRRIEKAAHRPTASEESVHRAAQMESSKMALFTARFMNTVKALASREGQRAKADTDSKTRLIACLVGQPRDSGAVGGCRSWNSRADTRKFCSEDYRETYMGALAERKSKSDAARRCIKQIVAKGLMNPVTRGGAEERNAIRTLTKYFSKYPFARDMHDPMR